MLCTEQAVIIWMLLLDGAGISRTTINIKMGIQCLASILLWNWRKEIV
jgi:hypothetical protein